MKNYTIRPIPVMGQYPFLVILSACTAGMLLQSFLPGISAFHWVIASLLLFLITAVLLTLPSIHVMANTVRLTALILEFSLLGAALNSTADIRNSKSWYGHYLDKAEAVKVKVSDVTVVKEKTVLIPATVEAVSLSGKWMLTNGPIKMYIYRKNFNSDYKPGQLLVIPNKLIAIKGSGNPFSFDVVKASARNGIFHQIFLAGNEVYAVRSKAARLPPMRRLRGALQASIDKNIKDSTTRALVAATLLNERSDLDENLMAAYSNTGIIHIIAISGMHIVLLASFILWLLRIIRSQKWKILKYSIAIVMVWLYIALTGFPPSAVRAAVMFTLMAIGLAFERDGNSVNTWAAAGTLLLCYNPYWLYDVGIQLSFLAVLSIVLFYTPVRNRITPKNKILRWLWETIAVSIAAQVLVFPLVIYYFHQFPLLGIPANIPAALYSTLLMFGGLCLFVLDALHCPVEWLGGLLTYCTKVFNNIIVFLSEGTPQLMRDMQIDKLEYCLMMGIVILICIGCLRKRGIYLLAGLSLCILFMADLIARDITALDQEKVVVYNTSKISQADWFHGKEVTHLFQPDPKQLKYSLRPAMLGFGINREVTDTTHALRSIAINHARILFLERCSLKSSSTFPVDILVVSAGCAFSPQQWFETFHPKLIVLDGSLPRWKASQWKDELAQAGAKVHWVQEDGAFIYPSL